jgi:regulator of replication initiation timing
VKNLGVDDRHLLAERGRKKIKGYVIIDTAKDVYALAAKGLTIDLQEKLMKLREQALELQEENLSLRTEVSSLRQKLDRKTELDFDGEVYKDSSEDAFCPSCYDKDGKLVRLHRNRAPEIQAKWLCRVCTHYF